ncbi:uncharacterized protein CDAR_269341 [Caerostris darwini]|uniref:Sodium channel protein Nach n=1 Tax=Caerostris darwini TaxID=1538125 RepID=A0AAV4NWR1_9ARAC|nr:uncharacterized protein CDAR_269341 [Caerostris darwini]
MSASKSCTWNAKFGHPSDVDWNQEPVHTPQRTTKPCSCSWNCGNPKKRRQLVERFAQTSSVHGTHFICSKKNTSRLLKLIYKVLFSLCILAVISNVALLLQEAFDQESTFINTLNKDVELGREEDPGYFPDYPQITLCRKPFYRADFNDSYRNLVEYSFLALGYPFIPFTPEEVSMIVEISMKLDHEKLKSEVLKFHNHLEDMEKRFQQLQNSTVDFNLQHFVMNNSVKCEEFFLYCIALVFPLNCCDIFRPVLTSMGLCYALIDSKEILRLLENAPVDFSVIIDLFSPPHLERSTEEGFNVFLSDPSETSLFFQPSEGQKIVPGLVTTVNAQLVKTERSALHTPWHSLTVNCPKWPFSSDPLNLKPHRYSYRTCDTYTYFISLRKACNCESVFFPGIPTLRYCRPKDIYICFTAATIANNFTDLVNICRQPCIVYRYKSEASYIGLGGENLR